MHRVMNMKGFILILAMILLAFLAGHLVLKGDLTRKADQERALREALAILEEENRDLQNQLEIVDTEGYIVASARDDYSFVHTNDIRFEYTNPEALYSYTKEELQVMVEEMGE